MDRLFEFSLINGVVNVDYRYFLADDFGLCYVAPDEKHNVIPIPKNASTEVNWLFRGWTRSNYKKLTKSIQHCVFLRDPTERWISGVTEFLIGDASYLGKRNQHIDISDIEVALDSPMLQNLLFNFAIFDDHTLPQCCFIDGINLDDTVFFFLDDTAVPRLANHLGMDLIASRLNSTKGNSKKEFISHKLKVLISKNKHFMNRIDTHFYADHQLFDAVKFQ